MSKIGRNDLCPCGSGKKYKHCCQDKIGVEKRTENTVSGFRQVTPIVEDERNSAREENTSSVIPLKKLIALTKQMQQKSVGKKMASQAEKLCQYVEFKKKEPAILVAVDVLDGYRDKYEDWTSKHPEDLFSRTTALFDELPFATEFFAVENIEQVVKIVGVPPPIEDKERLTEYLLRATRNLVSEEERFAIARLLYLQLPDFIAQKRFIDACIIMISATQLAENKQDQVCAFLTCRFLDALKEWKKKQEQEKVGILKRIGIDIEKIRQKIAGKLPMKLLDLALSKKQKILVEQYLADHPELNEELDEQSRELENSVVLLLKSELGNSLLLSNEETLPWVIRFVQTLLDHPVIAEKVKKKQRLDDPKTSAISMEILFQAGQEMLANVFTKARLRKLDTDISELLKRMQNQKQWEFCNTLSAWQTMNAAFHPKQNLYLSALCRTSLKETLAVTSRQQQLEME